MPALTRIGGVLVQLVEIPGLIGGAADDRGGGRALLGVLRTADAIVYCARADARSRRNSRSVRAEVAAAGIEKPAVPRGDARRRGGSRGHRPMLAAAFPDLPVVAVSVLDEASLDAFRDAVWASDRPDPGAAAQRRRVGRRAASRSTPDRPSTDVADWVHHDLAASFSGARVWGPSARFDGQRVGRDHEVVDGDVVEIVV